MQEIEFSVQNRMMKNKLDIRLPELKKIDKDNLSSYKSTMIALLEHAADILEINKFNILFLTFLCKSVLNVRSVVLF